MNDYYITEFHKNGIDITEAIECTREPYRKVDRSFWIKIIKQNEIVPNSTEEKRLAIPFGKKCKQKKLEWITFQTLWLFELLSKKKKIVTNY